MEEEIEQMKVEEVARKLHRGTEWVRAGLRQGTLPIGTAVQNPNGRYNYIIIKKKFDKWIEAEAS